MALQACSRLQKIAEIQHKLGSPPNQFREEMGETSYFGFNPTIQSEAVSCGWVIQEITSVVISFSGGILLFVV